MLLICLLDKQTNIIDSNEYVGRKGAGIFWIMLFLDKDRVLVFKFPQ